MPYLERSLENEGKKQNDVQSLTRDHSSSFSVKTASRVNSRVT